MFADSFRPVVRRRATVGSWFHSRRWQWVVAAAILGAAVPAFSEPLYQFDYESEPQMNPDFLAVWTTAEAHSGSHSVWLPPADPSIEWYQNPRHYIVVPPTPGLVKFTYWTKGGPASTQSCETIPYSSDWVQRSDFIPGDEGITFGLWSSGGVYVDDMVVTRSSEAEFAAAKHQAVADLGVHVRINQASQTQNRLPRTFEALRTGKPLRVVMLGDSIVADTWRSYWECYVKQQYPGAAITSIAAVRGSTDLGYYAGVEDDPASPYYGQPRIQQWVLDYHPDLVIMGGISGISPDGARDLIEELKASCSAELLLTSGAAGDTLHHHGDARLVSDWAFEPDPLGDTWSDQVYRIATDENVAFLDTRASWGDVTRQLPESVPYSILQRDGLHMNSLGSAIEGQTLEAYFAPVPEPATVGLLAPVAAWFLCRRSRRRAC